MLRRLALAFILLLVLPIATPAIGEGTSFVVVTRDAALIYSSKVGTGDGSIDVAIGPAGDGSGEAFVRMAPNGSVVRLADDILHSTLARTASDALVGYSSDAEAIVARSFAGDAPIVIGTLIGFGPDGKLYGFCSTLRSMCRVSADLTMEVLPTGRYFSGYKFSPTGILYGRDGRGLYAINFTSGVQTQVFWPTALIEDFAFDADGVAYIQFVYGDLVSWNPSTNQSTLLGHGPRGLVHVDLTFSGNHLWRAASEGNGAHYLGYYVLPSEGFLGFRPDFEPSPSPNLAVTHLSEERHAIDTPLGPAENDVNEVRTIRATVTNVGPGPAAASVLNVSVIGIRRESWSFEIPQLAPGESAAVQVAWDTTLHAGQPDIIAYADNERRLLEPTERDNRLSIRTVVRASTGLGVF